MRALVCDPRRASLPDGTKLVSGDIRSHPGSPVTSDRFIALDADRVEDAAGQIDLVLDTIGGEVLARSPALLRPRGTLVSTRVGESGPVVADLRPHPGAAGVGQAGKS